MLISLLKLQIKSEFTRQLVIGDPYLFSSVPTPYCCMASPPPLKKKRVSHFDLKWIEEFKGIERSHKGIVNDFRY